MSVPDLSSALRARIAEWVCAVPPDQWRGLTSTDAEAMVLAEFPAATFDDFAAAVLMARSRLQVLAHGGGTV